MIMSVSVRSLGFTVRVLYTEEARLEDSGKILYIPALFCPVRVSMILKEVRFNSLIYRLKHILDSSHYQSGP